VQAEFRGTMWGRWLLVLDKREIDVAVEFVEGGLI
jgi:hypothetical protein